MTIYSNLVGLLIISNLMLAIDSDLRLVTTFKHFAYYWRVSGDVQRDDKFEMNDNHTLALGLKNVGVMKVTLFFLFNDDVDLM